MITRKISVKIGTEEYFKEKFHRRSSSDKPNLPEKYFHTPEKLSVSEAPYSRSEIRNFVPHLTRFPEIPQEQTPHVIILPPIYSAAENSGNISKRQNFPKKQKNSENNWRQ